MTMDPATARVVIIGGPWPERIGCAGEVVPALRDEYPWDRLSPDHVVVRLDHDPLTTALRPRAEWTCVIERADLRSES